MAKAKRVERGDTGLLYGHAIECPGCGHWHVFAAQMNDGTIGWNFNGDLEKPTFTPSMRTYTVEKGVERTLCHSWVRDGVIDFLPDSTGHSLRGPVPLPDIE